MGISLVSQRAGALSKLYKKIGVLANRAPVKGTLVLRPLGAHFARRAKVLAVTADNPHMSFQRESNGPAPLEALFRADTVNMECSEDEDDHAAFVMSLSRLAFNLATVAVGSQPVPAPARQ